MRLIRSLGNILVKKRPTTLLETILGITLLISNIILMCMAYPLITDYTNADKTTTGMATFMDGVKFMEGYDGDELEYVEDVFDCKNFSDYFLEYAKENKVYCEKKSGCTNGNETSCHRWVRCDIEPQSGEFVDYSKYYAREFDVLNRK